eukprot:gnl/TRDRNA2_/TRDRNA2_85531_c0_seq1.p1 gnl/TRDRNA2_/TRDRNA2_85531_c0~~gnl/TRDRNA2_/TRDRNA2_85531_c0_seq1.p1  ORF type:complete len:327 (+),score=61.20 gnl/TRDRNA2_/TRDRNA2_85531_c0_seq1:58-1038(+)
MKQASIRAIPLTGLLLAILNGLAHAWIGDDGEKLEAVAKPVKHVGTLAHLRKSQGVPEVSLDNHKQGHTHRVVAHSPRAVVHGMLHVKRSSNFPWPTKWANPEEEKKKKEVPTEPPDVHKHRHHDVHKHLPSGEGDDDDDGDDGDEDHDDDAKKHHYHHHGRDYWRDWFRRHFGHHDDDDDGDGDDDNDDDDGGDSHADDDSTAFAHEPAPAPAPAPAGPAAWYEKMDESEPAAEQGFMGEGVAHDSGATMTSDWQAEFGPAQGNLGGQDPREICKKHQTSRWCRIHGYLGSRRKKKALSESMATRTSADQLIMAVSAAAVMSVLV